MNLAVYFDSTLLTWDSLTNAFDAGLVSADVEAVADTDDGDNDPATDAVVYLEWSDGAAFPFGQTIKLVDVNFIASDTSAGSATNINYIASEANSSSALWQTEPTTLEFSPSVHLDIDGNGEIEPFVDGFLIIRALLGFTGEDLTRGLVSEGETLRSTPEEILAWINDGLATMLDVDGNNAGDAFTDGMMILRDMLGFSIGGAIAGLVGENAQRDNADAIGAHLNTYSGPPSGGQDQGGAASIEPQTVATAIESDPAADESAPDTVESPSDPVEALPSNEPQLVAASFTADQADDDIQPSAFQSLAQWAQPGHAPVLREIELADAPSLAFDHQSPSVDNGLTYIVTTPGFYERPAQPAQHWKPTVSGLTTLFSAPAQSPTLRPLAGLASLEQLTANLREV